MYNTVHASNAKSNFCIQTEVDPYKLTSDATHQNEMSFWKEIYYYCTLQSKNNNYKILNVYF